VTTADPLQRIRVLNAATRALLVAATDEELAAARQRLQELTETAQQEQ
jgi:hypothetical protein